MRLYAQQDANYNVTAEVDANGNVVQRYVYSPYGTMTVLSATWTPQSDLFDTQVGYQGMWLDQASGLYHTPNRDYDPATGTWREADGGYWDGGDLYQMDDSDPSSLLDPFGQAPDPDWSVDTGPGGSLRTRIVAEEHWLDDNPRPPSGECPAQLQHDRGEHFLTLSRLMVQLGAELSRRRDYHYDRFNRGPNYRTTGDNMSDKEQEAAYEYWALPVNLWVDYC